MSEISRRDFLKLTGAAAISTFLAACGFDPNSTDTDPTATLPIPTSTKEIHSAGQYEFIEESEIISKLSGPFKAFTNDEKVKDLFEDPTTIKYSASGIKVYDLNGNPTAYTFFNATSEKEEKGRTAMVFGGDQGEVVYLVLNRIIDSDGNVGLGITKDPSTGKDLEKYLMIFNTGLSETEIENMTIQELSSRNINFIPGGILIPSDKLLGTKVQAMLLKPEVQPSESMLTTNALENGKWGNYSIIENSNGYYEMKDSQGNLIPDVKLFRDGTAELTYSSKKLAIAFQAVSIGAEGQLALGLWDFKNGEWTMSAGHNAEDIRSGEYAKDFHKLVVIRGNDEIEKKLTDTIFTARDLYMNNTEGYRPESEFEGITVTYNFKTVENFNVRPKEWQISNFSRNWSMLGKEGAYVFRPFSYSNEVVYEDRSTLSHARPLQISLDSGWFNVEIYNRDKTLQTIYHASIVGMNTNGSLIHASSLIDEESLSKMMPLLNREDRGKIRILLFSKSITPVPNLIFATTELMNFTSKINNENYIDKIGVPKLDTHFTLNSLPKEISSTFLTLVKEP